MGRGLSTPACVLSRAYSPSRPGLVGHRGVAHRVLGGRPGGLIAEREPEILNLDEATSALDAETERLVLDNVRRLMRGAS
jgi:hypothetical protein